MVNKINPKIFISYSSRDINEALAIRRIFAENNCTVWLDVFDIRVSEELKSELGGGITQADVFCLLLSPTSVTSEWVMLEIEKGLKEASTRNMRVIPIILRPCTIPDALRGLVSLDASKGIEAPTVGARLMRSIFGNEKVSDIEIDAAFQKEMQEREEEMEAMLQLPELGKKVASLSNKPIQEFTISFDKDALPAGKILALALEFDTLFSQPMWFLFAHFIEGSTWPKWMKKTIELDHDDIPDDSKRIDGRFEWFDHLSVLECTSADGTDLQDLPASFTIKLDGKEWNPDGSVSTYQGGPSVPHMRQTMQVPGLPELIKKDAKFYLSLINKENEKQEKIISDENDLNVKVTAVIDDKLVTLFNSTHSNIDKSVLKGNFLAQFKSAIEREAILSFYPKSNKVASEERQKRRIEAHELLKKPIDKLTPDERRIAGLLRYGNARLEIFRCYNSAPPPGKARQQLHERALNECWELCQTLAPIAEKDPRIDDVGMVYWALNNLAEFFRRIGDKEQAHKFSEMSVEFIECIVALDNKQPAYKRWLVSAKIGFARILDSNGKTVNAMNELTAAIELSSAMYKELKNKARKKDLATHYREALEISAGWKEYEKAHSAWQSQLKKLN